MSWEEICKNIMFKSKLNNKKYYEWLLSKENLKGVFFNPLMWKKLYLIQKEVNNDDMDHFIVNTSREGFGKSTFSIQQACVLDPNWNLNKLLYEPSQLIERIKNSNPGDCLVLDEGNLFLFSREAMTGGNKFMVKLFALFRQRNLIVIINVPNFFTLDSYVRDHRTRTLNFISARGKFQTYKGKAIRIVSGKGSRFKQIAGIKVPPSDSFKGWFSKYLPATVSEEEYRAYKKKNFDEFVKEIEQGVADANKKPALIDANEASRITSVARETLYKKLKKGEIKGKKIGGKVLFDRVFIENLAKIDNFDNEKSQNSQN